MQQHEDSAAVMRVVEPFASQIESEFVMEVQPFYNSLYKPQYEDMP